MLRPLKARLNPETVSWAVGFALLETSVASCLTFFGVGAGLTLAWVLLASGIFAAGEPGLFTWFWAGVIARDEEEPPEPHKSAAPPSPEGASPSEEPSRPQDSAEPEKPELTMPREVEGGYEKQVQRLIRSRSSNVRRLVEVVISLVLAGLSYLGSQAMQGRTTPPKQADLQKMVDQIRSDVKTS